MPVFGKRLYLTPLFLGLQILAGIYSGTFAHALPLQIKAVVGVGLQPLQHGRVWHLFTSMFFSNGPVMLFEQFLFAGLVLGFAEWKWGGWLAGAWFVGLNTLGTLVLYFGLVWPFSHVFAFASAWPSLLDVGMSGGGSALIGMVLVCGLPRQWARPAVIFIYVLLLALAISPKGLQTDLLHLLTFTMGLVAGGLLFTHRKEWRTQRP